ncbi:hypothetical protein CANTEDRAFT_113692 [Yamadazyma tenuis ATCC 10573]|uniref:Uncharacterized protein n=1 Tax=Candida tenuis (strain ATCC 10573 / BCRC 21748 / CBS 615 / JCM 9827 / NBRC 10315 / NRRL Y-1498 / VKM Y-70) TaxID=590646 RepID=G3B1D8_CANTC|nr:uncharacterized protein CANTEDRAFT_113692 [Yamadazyma tenuis ATCC 10573]EGV64948.1 hypothetical protein CANTEDRAFT_113692 [Yamadazyma tenuis ATCC 10573]
MAFNKYQLNYPTTRIVVNHEEDEVRSILSDDQSSWVLFNPDSDILSSTTQDHDQDDESTDAEISQDEDIGDHREPQSSRQADQSSRQPTQPDVESDNDTDTDSLIDNLDPSQSRLEGLFKKSYDRINNWNLTSDVVDDNVASWDLDEDLSNNSLDTSILDKRPFYGNELIRNLNKKDLQKFRKIHANLRNYLNRKPPSPLLEQLLSKMSTQTISRPQPPYNLNMGYNRYLKATISSYYDYDDLTSETASSSMVLCGGGETWNDI